MNVNKQKGFTLIELIIVIVILGILAAMILPRFAALDSKARIAAVNGLQGTLVGAAAIAHGAFLADGSSPATVSIEGAPVAILNGYPDSTSGGIGNAINQNALGNFTLSAGGTGTTLTFTLRTNCLVTYAAATGGNPPVVTQTITGCS